jgi:hypothetical protein
MNHWTPVAVAALLAGIVCIPMGSRAKVEHTANESSAQRFYGELLAFERDTNCVVRRVLGTVTGQPASTLRARAELPPRAPGLSQFAAPNSGTSASLHRYGAGSPHLSSLADHK